MRDEYISIYLKIHFTLFLIGLNIMDVIFTMLGQEQFEVYDYTLIGISIFIGYSVLYTLIIKLAYLNKENVEDKGIEIFFENADVLRLLFLLLGFYTGIVYFTFNIFKIENTILSILVNSIFIFSLFWTFVVIFRNYSFHIAKSRLFRPGFIFVCFIIFLIREIIRFILGIFKIKI